MEYAIKVDTYFDDILINVRLIYLYVCICKPTLWHAYRINDLKHLKFIPTLLISMLFQFQCPNVNPTSKTSGNVERPFSFDQIHVCKLSDVLFLQGRYRHDTYDVGHKKTNVWRRDAKMDVHKTVTWDQMIFFLLTSRQKATHYGTSCRSRTILIVWRPLINVQSLTS